MSRLRAPLIGAVLAVLISTTMSAGILAQEEPVGPIPEVPPGEPFGGLVVGSISFMPVDPPTEDCPMVRTITDASGPTTLGTMTLHTEHCPTVGMPTIPYGEATFTTDGGDELSATYYADCDPILPANPSGEPIVCHGRMEFTGGTGQFAAATGSAFQRISIWFPGSFETQGWLWVNEFHGLLSY
jgi:hypothetical protein